MIYILTLLFFSSAHASIHDWKADPRAAAFEIVKEREFQYGAERASPVHFDDVKSWRALGHRWAAGYADDGTLLAIYDLSFADIHQRVPLGAIGTKRFTFGDILSAILRGRKETGRDGTIVGQVIDLLKKQSGSASDALPENWWKSVPWKNSKLGRSLPARFTLADIDFARLAGEEFEERIRAAENASDDEDPVLGEGFLASFEFDLLPGGGYALIWSPKDAAPPRPRKVADLRDLGESFRRAMTVALLEKGLSMAVDQIPLPPVAAMVSTAVDRFFYFRKQMIRARQDMILEMLADAPRGSPFSALSAEERKRIAEYQMLGFSTVKNSWRWLFTTPEKAWRESLEDEAEAAQASLAWLGSQNRPVEVLNARFARSAGDSVLLLALHARSGPYAGINYRDPDEIKYRRRGTELLSTAVCYGLYFVPFGGFLLAWAYDWIVSDPEEMRRRWEWRLIAHLEERGESWDQELDALYGQTENPFELSRAASERLIAARKRALGI